MLAMLCNTINKLPPMHCNALNAMPWHCLLHLLRAPQSSCSLQFTATASHHCTAPSTIHLQRSLTFCCSALPSTAAHFFTFFFTILFTLQNYILNFVLQQYAAVHCQAGTAAALQLFLHQHFFIFFFTIFLH